MRPASLLSLFARSPRRLPAQARATRKSRLAAAERLEARINFTATLIDLAVPRDASGGFPAYDQLPIPAGASLVDVSDSGRYVLFSSADTNVIKGQQTIPSIHQDLFWLDTQSGITRLVTHRAGSTVQSAGYAGVEGSTWVGPGLGLWAKFEPLTADLSGDGQSVVFDSVINANEYDASVPVQNDQATFRPFEVTGQGQQQTFKNIQMGTVDVFVWRANGVDPANNISLVSRLNATGQQQAVALAPSGLTPPIAGQPMATGVFSQETVFSPNPTDFFSPSLVEPIESQTLNKGISDDGTRVLYDSWVPAGWIDTVKPDILDTGGGAVDARLLRRQQHGLRREWCRRPVVSEDREHHQGREGSPRLPAGAMVDRQIGDRTLRADVQPDQWQRQAGGVQHAADLRGHRGRHDRLRLFLRRVRQ
jgi:hypothetical protein